MSFPTIASSGPEITLRQASRYHRRRQVLGTSVDIETIDKRHIDLRVPAGVQYNTALKISGEGIRRRGKPGDLLIRVKIVTPRSVSSEQKELYQKIAEMEGKSHNGGGFFSNIMGGGKKKGKK